MPSQWVSESDGSWVTRPTPQGSQGILQRVMTPPESGLLVGDTAKGKAPPRPTNLTYSGHQRA